VAAIIVSDGGDTLSVYLPLFATFMHSRHHSSLGKGPLAVATLLVIAYSVLAMWCGVAQRVVKMPILRTLVTKWGRFFVPLLLIGIGAYVLFEYDAHLLMGQ
jgi:cadmium resistance protein CadD (predicted permease)